MAEPAIDELAAALGEPSPACSFPKPRWRTRRFLWWSWRQTTMTSEDEVCGKPAAQRVQMRCPCATQTGWACLEHVALLRHPAAQIACGQDHPAEVVFL